MDAFEKGLQDRFRNGPTKEWTCHLCGQKEGKNVYLKTDSNSLVWCSDCIYKSMKVYPVTIKNSQSTPGRNQPCFCGSEKKYKTCHGKKGG